jgi:hypothetical protein
MAEPSPSRHKRKRCDDYWVRHALDDCEKREDELMTAAEDVATERLIVEAMAEGYKRIVVIDTQHEFTTITARMMKRVNLMYGPAEALAFEEMKVPFPPVMLVTTRSCDEFSRAIAALDDWDAKPSCACVEDQHFHPRAESESYSDSASVGSRNSDSGNGCYCCGSWPWTLHDPLEFAVVTAPHDVKHLSEIAGPRWHRIYRPTAGWKKMRKQKL